MLYGTRLYNTMKNKMKSHVFNLYELNNYRYTMYTNLNRDEKKIVVKCTCTIYTSDDTNDYRIKNINEQESDECIVFGLVPFYILIYIHTVYFATYWMAFLFVG